MTMEELRSEVDRAYRVLGAERGYGQNWTDIHAWKKEKRMSYKEEKELLRYNRVRYAEECANGNW